MFRDKVVVITGAGSGIGRALALQFAELGARPALSDIDQSGLDETIRLLPGSSQEHGGERLRVRGYVLDVSSRDAVFAHAQDLKLDFGFAHVLVNNAGVAVFGTVANVSIEEFEWQLGINMWGVLFGTKAFLPMMLAQREGCIVNISSVFGLLGFPTQGAYSMAKFALRGLTECLWTELEGSGVRAVCVHPGGVKTNIDKAGRLCKAAEEQDKAFLMQAGKLLLTPPEQCAADIIRGLKRRDRRIITGNGAGKLYWMSRLFPNSYPRLLRMLSG